MVSYGTHKNVTASVNPQIAEVMVLNGGIKIIAFADSSTKHHKTLLRNILT